MIDHFEKQFGSFFMVNIYPPYGPAIPFRYLAKKNENYVHTIIHI